jgi:hypothetical protein
VELKTPPVPVFLSNPSGERAKNPSGVYLSGDSVVPEPSALTGYFCIRILSEDICPERKTLKYFRRPGNKPSAGTGWCVQEWKT